MGVIVSTSKQEIHMQAKSKTQIAKEMISSGSEYGEVEQVTGLRRDSIRKIAHVMRCDGELDRKISKQHYRYIGKNDKGQVVEFRSLADANENGFHCASVSACARGLRESYAGYKWERKSVYRAGGGKFPD